MENINEQIPTCWPVLDGDVLRFEKYHNIFPYRENTTRILEEDYSFIINSSTRSCGEVVAVKKGSTIFFEGTAPNGNSWFYIWALGKWRRAKKGMPRK